jgi:sulfur carrier protein ThiS
MIANHNFRRVIQKGLAVLAALLLSGCPDTLGGGGPADTKALAAAIASAQSAKTGVLSSVDGADVPEESYWASAAAFAALNDAIAAGETALGDGAATQAVVDDAAAALTAATAAFVAAKQQGTAVAAADKAALVAAIASAQTAKTGVTVSVDGTDVPESGWWTTRAALDALNNAVAAAETVSQNAAATQDEADAAAATLAEATDTFTAAKQPGTGSGVEAADKTALVTAIASAQAAKTGVAVSADGTDVPESGWWTTRAALDVLNNAVDAAEAVSHNASVTQDDADNTAATLIEATVTFTAAKQPGTYVPPADRTALATAIEEAQAEKTGVVVSSTNGANVSPDRQWVNASVLAALNDTIAAAETVFQNAAATQAETDAATATLTEATATFTAAKQSGLKGAAVITVSPQGLGISFNLRFVDPPGPGGFASGAYGTATITKGYWMGETEVTQELFEAVMGANPSYFTVGAASGEIQRRRPVDQASWYAASLLQQAEPAGRQNPGLQR